LTLTNSSTRNAGGDVLAADGATVVPVDAGNPVDTAAVIIPQPTLAVQVAFLTLINRSRSRHWCDIVYSQSCSHQHWSHQLPKQGRIYLYQQGTKSLYEDSKERFELKGDLRVDRSPIAARRQRTALIDVGTLQLLTSRTFWKNMVRFRTNQGPGYDLHRSG
jgi:hypothetical protein